MNNRTAFQEPEGSFTIDQHQLTEQELMNLIALMPDANWIVVRWAYAEDLKLTNKPIENDNT